MHVRIKLHQSGDSFRLFARPKEEYELHVLNTQFVCHMTVIPEVARAEPLEVQPTTLLH